MSDNLQRNKDVIKRMFLCIEKADTEGMRALLSDDLQFVTMGTTPLSMTRNRDELIRDLIKTVISGTKSGVAFDIVSMTAEEDRVSCEVEGRSTLKNGNPYNNQYHLLAYVRDGKVYKAKEYLDTKLVETAFCSVAP